MSLVQLFKTSWRNLCGVPPPMHFLKNGFAMAINYWNQLTQNFICLWGFFYLLTKLEWGLGDQGKDSSVLWVGLGGRDTNGGGRPQIYWTQAVLLPHTFSARDSRLEQLDQLRREWVCCKPSHESVSSTEGLSHQLHIIGSVTEEWMISTWGHS